jgi:hypothetical protein
MRSAHKVTHDRKALTGLALQPDTDTNARFEAVNLKTSHVTRLPSHLYGNAELDRVLRM